MSSPPIRLRLLLGLDGKGRKLLMFLFFLLRPYGLNKHVTFHSFLSLVRAILVFLSRLARQNTSLGACLFRHPHPAEHRAQLRLILRDERLRTIRDDIHVLLHCFKKRVETKIETRVILRVLLKSGKELCVNIPSLVTHT